MDRETIRRCREFVSNRVLQRQTLAMRLKMDIANNNRFVEVGQRLGELKPFVDYFYDDIVRKYDSTSDFYNHCNISRQIFSNMQRDDYDPKIETVYKIIIGLKLDLLDATILLENAGYTFTFKTKTQLVVIFCIINRIYEPEDVDFLLADLGEPTLFSLE